MPTPDLYPFPFATLVDRIDREVRAFEADPKKASIYNLPRREWWVPDPAVDLSFVHFGTRLGNPLGPASGPHTQLAQNLVLSWLAGSRFMELKTVQVNDELEIPRPCIHVPHIGYNVEWSQELRVPQSAHEYVKGWMLVHMLASEVGPGLWGQAGPRTAFDVSLGYDLAGIQTEKVRAYLDVMRDASGLIGTLQAELPRHLERWATVPVPDQVSQAITLSTFHGCPADEIEAIASQTLDWGWHTVIKLNPTLLGHDRVRSMLDRMGYGFIKLDPHAFEVDLQWDQLMEMAPRLKAQAEGLGLGFGFKLTNTLVCHSEDTPFDGPGDEKAEMYLSGPPLHVLSYTLAAELRDALSQSHPWGRTLPLTFSAGVDQGNVVDCVAGGLGPVTTCSDLLKGRGYGRLPKYLKKLEAHLAAEGVDSLANLPHHSDPPTHLRGVAATLLDDPRHHAATHSQAPKKVGSQLVLLDCLTCDKCVPVCPNAANFTVPVEQGEWNPGRIQWREGEFSLSAGEPLIAAKRHQIGNCADACNLCGQCDTWCPEDGGPYIVKPGLFLTDASFSDHPGRDGFVVDPDRQGLRWRRGDALLHYRKTEGGARLETAEGWVSLEGDTPVATGGTGEIDLRDAVTLRLFLAGFTHPDAEVWLAPG
jgi:putative selenate reductase